MDDLKRNKFGLTERDMVTIHKVFNKFPDIQSVSLCGSRAKGNYKPGSDIDLAIMNPGVDFNIISKLQTEFEESNLPYRVDLTNFSSIKNNDLIDHIQRVGVQFYSKDENKILS